MDTNNVCHQCVVCNEIFQQYDDFEKHYKIHIIIKDEETEDVETLHQCNLCDEEFKLETDLEKHCEVDHTEVLVDVKVEQTNNVEDEESEEGDLEEHILDVDNISLGSNFSDVSSGEEEEEDPDGTIVENDQHGLPSSSNFIWKTTLNSVMSPSFLGPLPGPTGVLEEKKNEFDYFSLFFGSNLYTIIADETNRCHAVKHPNGEKKWRNVTAEEVKAFLGLRVFMSVSTLPRTGMYWSREYYFGNYKIADIMTRDRYNKISEHLHINDKSTNPARGEINHDKLHQVRPVLDHVLDNCSKRYNPHQNTSIAEAMVAFRGRIGFKQFTPSKLVKHGIKVWMRADPTNGYVNEFQVYTGREKQTSEIGLSSRVVLDLTRKVQFQNMIVNVDDHFTCAELFSELEKVGIFARGMCKNTRKNWPKGLKQNHKDVKNWASGEYKIVQSTNLTAGMWKDRKIINFMSTADSPLETVDVLRKQKDSTPSDGVDVSQKQKNGTASENVDLLRKEKGSALSESVDVSRKPKNGTASETVDLLQKQNGSIPLETMVVSRKQKDIAVKGMKCPVAISKYFSNMSGVDRSDQLRMEYPTYRMSKKWWLYLFYFLFDLCIANAFILFKESKNQSKKSKNSPPILLEFKMNLFKKMIGNERNGRKRKRCDFGSDLPTTTGRHFPMKATKKARCRQCMKSKKRAESLYQCDNCFVHLCVLCFRAYHESE
ncbi:piggyBac transposable element-derived protein 3 [Patella vulgata]|uniref:piggyBac transposable element-derived protein 3 n=1 Tax=Patella vulgata TaxID=6465 RepID=UPI00217F7DDD|nr:piggyBac transposable element-derived protein 3 [Patella vulgata]